MTTEPIVARPWQEQAFHTMVPAQHALCQAPGGGGKGTLQCMAGAADLNENPRQKQLILVPQQHIHHGFYGDRGEVCFEVAGHRLELVEKVGLLPCGAVG